MDVYHDGNHTGIPGKNRRRAKLAALPVSQSFRWEGQEIFIPAVYVGKAGAVLDVCAKIQTGDMAAFFKKWDKKARQAAATQEKYEQMQAEDPASGDFIVNMSLDGTPLALRVSSSLRWYCEEIIQMENENPEPSQKGEPSQKRKPGNGQDAEKWMEAYGYSRKFCWHFGRLTYDWTGKPILSAQKISLAFQASPVSVTAGHFTTGVSCDGETVWAVHPVTGQEYTLTLHGCEQTRHSFAGIGRKGVVYPECCQVLSYSITPEIGRGILMVRDCADGDQPRPADPQKELDACVQAAPGIFLAGKSNIPGRRAAISSLYFEPVEEVQWRTVFEVRKKSPMEITLPVKPGTSDNK